MKLPLSWLKDFVDIDLSVEETARLLTSLGLEVGEVKLLGYPMPPEGDRQFKYHGLEWPAEQFVVAQVNEVKPHPDAEKLVLCDLNDGQEDRVVLTGAPNLYPYKGKGPLETPLKVAYAKLGSELYDGHKPGLVLTKLKKAKIRGVESDSMICSEKELGISDEHEGVIILDDDAPTGMPLVDYIGDAVFDIEIMPNTIRNACVLGVAREIAAATNQKLLRPTYTTPTDGPSILGQASVEITDPDLNPRFVLGLIKGVTPMPSPYWVQRRLRMAGIRPINSIVDATNYVMLEVNEPLHAFDYDVLIERAGGKAPTIITRLAKQGEKLTTLDGEEHELEDYTILVTDTAGPLSLAGVMGGLESEVTDSTKNVLLEGAAWNFVNVRKTVKAKHMNSEASYRFSRDLHPAIVSEAVKLGLDCMAKWSGGQIAADLIDNYPNPVEDPTVAVSPQAVKAKLGITLTAEEIVGLLIKLEFDCRIENDTVYAKTPDHRKDISSDPVIALSDILEEIARMYGYDNIPATRLSDTLPGPQGNNQLNFEQKVRDILVSLQLQEIINYRQTAPETEAKATVSGQVDESLPYVRLANLISPDRSVMRRSLVPQLVSIIERNSRLSQRLAFFEAGPIFLPKEGQALPDEPQYLSIGLAGLRQFSTWDASDEGIMNFYDLKGIIEALLHTLHVQDVTYVPDHHPSMHPQRCAAVMVGETKIGVFGELHPSVQERYDLGKHPVEIAEFDLCTLFANLPARFEITPVPTYPPILEDIAVIVDENVPADQVLAVIQKAGGKLLANADLFDVFRGEQIGANKKSLAYALTYQSPDKTLTDKDATKIRKKIVALLDRELGAQIRSS
jgi:phenylalanyl-tRNA synthetase beta chain